MGRTRPVTCALVVISLCALAVVPSRATGQLPHITPGARVRLTSPVLLPGPVAGPLLARIGDTLVVGQDGEAARVAIPIAALDALEESTGHPRLLWGATGGGIGFLAGGLILGVTAYLSDPHWGDVLGTLGFIAGGVVGAPLGAAIGATIAPEGWIPLILPQGDSAGVPAPHRVEVLPGTRVRVTPRSGGRFTARAGVRGDTLTAQRRDGAAIYPLETIRVLEVRGGRDRARGAAVWAAALGGVALVFGGIDLAREEIEAGEFFGGIAGNTLVGAGIGALFPPRGWRPLPLPAPAPPPP